MEKRCLSCGNIFYRSNKKDWLNSKFCSHKCINKGRTPWNKGKKSNIPAWNKGLKKCLNTGRTHIKKGQHLSAKTQFGNKEPWNKGKSGVYSKEHLEKMRNIRLGNPLHFKIPRGVNHWNWKGGVTSENSKLRKSVSFRLWRNDVYQRDNFTCQKCLVRGGRLNPHHIKNLADNKIDCYKVKNGITLCEKCHKLFHKIYGKHNNTKEQLKQFLQLRKFNLIKGLAYSGV